MKDDEYIFVTLESKDPCVINANGRVYAIECVRRSIENGTFVCHSHNGMDARNVQMDGDNLVCEVEILDMDLLKHIKDGKCHISMSTNGKCSSIGSGSDDYCLFYGFDKEHPLVEENNE